MVRTHSSARRQLGVLVAVNLLVEHHPLAVGQHRVDAPVDKDAEFVVLELLASLEVFLAGDISGLLCIGAQARRQQQEKG